jgi:AcrR family transcriptional regulator
MAPEDRRAALIAATIPLLHEHGLEVSTRQIAAAAGVAEGTIFGVFKDKSSLLVASVVRALDSQPTIDAMAAIDPRLSLHERLGHAADLVIQRFATNARLMIEARKLLLTSGDSEAIAWMTSSQERLLVALTTVVEPSAGELRKTPADTARLLLLFCGASVFGPYGDPDNVSGAEMVSLLLDGLLIIPAGDRSLVVPLIGKTDKC